MPTKFTAKPDWQPPDQRSLPETLQLTTLGEAAIARMVVEYARIGVWHGPWHVAGEHDSRSLVSARVGFGRRPFQVISAGETLPTTMDR